MRTDYAGKTVKVNEFVDPYVGRVQAGTDYEVEGYWDDIVGRSWKNGKVYAESNYAQRVVFEGLPYDDEVLYGKIGGLGFLVHVSEVQ